MLDAGQWPLGIVVAAFFAAAVAIGVFGTQMTKMADRLADLTGLGEAIFGAVFLGASTSLPGIITSVASAWKGHPDLAISNALGGIAVQTFFLAIADVTYRKVNLEHAAASLQNMLQGTLLVVLLSLPILLAMAPSVAIAGIHPGTFVVCGVYIYGIRLVAEAKNKPMWSPRQTSETREDEPEESEEGGPSLAATWTRFGVFALVLAVSGYMVTITGIAIAERTGLSETVVGSLGTAIVTSLPELVTALAAVRHGALTMAVGGVIGGNCFDVLFLAASDIAYRKGSIYHQAADRHVFITIVSVTMTAVLLMGMLRREKTGPGNIGFESTVVVVLYLMAAFVLFRMG